MTYRPRTFTFYSYKGGVGRSMALLNVAYTLHSLGRHVLIVDLDLEAPGISGFLRRNEELEPAPADQPDVVDLLDYLMPAIQWELGSESRPDHPQLEPYIRSVRTDLEKYAPAQNPGFRRTRLDVLCASDERNYADRLAALDISRLTGAQLEQAGNLLREVFFQHRFPWRWVPEEEDQPAFYDYILIDSRTGFNETSGLCIGPLADRLLIFCGLNDQNINGTAEFLKVVGLTPELRREKWDDADDPTDTSRASSLGEKPTLLIASPVPSGEMEEKARRFDIMEKRLGVVPAASVSYHPRLSVLETIFCRDGKHELITREYHEIAKCVLAMVGDHPAQWNNRLIPFGPLEKQPVPSVGELRRLAALLDAEDLEPFASTRVQTATQLTRLAALASGAKADALFSAAGGNFQAALALKPTSYEALHNWGYALSERAKQHSNPEADVLFAAAGEKFQGALALKPTSHETLNNWGNALSAQAQQKSGAEADVWFAAAGEKFQAALAINPISHETLNNWGNALSAQAQQKSGEEAGALFNAAEKKYEAALAIKPSKYETFNNWGNALSAQAKHKSGAEAGALFKRAGDKYNASLAIKPVDHETLYNYGVALYEQAKQKIGAEADTLFNAAEEKYKAALAIKPDFLEALNIWGAALCEQTKQKSGAEAEALFKAAEEKYKTALAIKPDLHALNNWGCALSNRAKQKCGAEADALFIAAGEKFQAALALKPEFHEALNNWAIALFTHANQKSGEEADALFTAAAEKLMVALSFAPRHGPTMYNLACLAALREDVSACLKWLKRASEAGEPQTRRKLDLETDFDKVRRDAEFQRFRDSLT